jgi:hypothetical protein
MSSLSNCIYLKQVVVPFLLFPLLLVAQMKKLVSCVSPLSNVVED